MYYLFEHRAAGTIACQFGSRNGDSQRNITKCALHTTAIQCYPCFPSSTFFFIDEMLRKTTLSMMPITVNTPPIMAQTWYQRKVQWAERARACARDKARGRIHDYQRTYNNRTCRQTNTHARMHAPA